jgi:hypothetical protein
MLKEVFHTDVVGKEEKANNRFIQFIDGREFDLLLQFLLKGLFGGIIFFCLPYFCFLLISLLF